MITALILIYFTILLIPIFRRGRNWFAPPVLMSITMIFYTVPDLLGIIFGGYEEYVNNIGLRLNNRPNVLVERFVLCQIIFLSVYYCSYYYMEAKNYKIRLIPFNIKKYNPVVLRLIAYVLIILCLYATISYISSKGGLLALFMSFTNRNELNSQRPFIQRILPTLMTFATAFCMWIILNDRKSHIFLFVILVITGFFTYTSNGGRSQLVVFIFSLLCYYNYWKKKINLFSPKFYPLYGLMGLFIISFQLLRFKESQSFNLADLFANSDSLFDSMAYVRTQILIQNYFDKFDFWWGELFTFIPFIFIPSSIYPIKPNIDEGTYIFNMMSNIPNILSDNNWVNSWPPFTVGTGYANFGVFGIILFGFILAIIHVYFYKLLKASKESLFVMPLYIFIVLKFQITIFYIANFAYLLIFTFLIYKLYCFLSLFKINFHPKCPKYFK